MAEQRAVLSLDIGEKRIGIAIATQDTRWPRPLTTLRNDDSFLMQLQTTIAAEHVVRLVAGLPRGLDGQETAQTQYVRQFCEVMQSLIELPLHYQDEALTSQKAKAELDARGKIYQKEAVDALAATYILEDFLNSAEAVI